MQQIHQPTIAAQVDPGQGWVNVDEMASTFWY